MPIFWSVERDGDVVVVNCPEPLRCAHETHPAWMGQCAGAIRDELRQLGIAEGTLLEATVAGDELPLGRDARSTRSASPSRTSAVGVRLARMPAAAAGVVQRYRHAAVGAASPDDDRAARVGARPDHATGTSSTRRTRCGSPRAMPMSAALPPEAAASTGGVDLRVRFVDRRRADAGQRRGHPAPARRRERVDLRLRGRHGQRSEPGRRPHPRGRGHVRARRITAARDRAARATGRIRRGSRRKDARARRRPARDRRAAAARRAARRRARARDRRDDGRLRGEPRERDGRDGRRRARRRPRRAPRARARPRSSRYGRRRACARGLSTAAPPGRYLPVRKPHASAEVRDAARRPRARTDRLQRALVLVAATRL